MCTVLNSAAVRTSSTRGTSRESWSRASSHSRRVATSRRAGMARTEECVMGLCHGTEDCVMTLLVSAAWVVSDHFGQGVPLRVGRVPALDELGEAAGCGV